MRRLTAVLCAVPIVLLAAAAWNKRWVTDDAFINLRVVANLQDGFGPVWNPGERVEVFTSPAWLAVLWVSSSILWFVSLEWVSVLLGFALTLVGMIAAARGALLLWRNLGRTRVGLPLGLVVVAALRPTWNFTTSGLETGMTFAWLGGSFWVLVLLHVRPLRPRAGEGWRRWLPRVTPTTAAVLIGLGPLVRPDLAIFSAGFLVALVAGPLAPGVARKLRLAVTAVALPLAYQVFRMGYFAALGPNTALAKEAGSSEWARGWRYLKDLVETYELLVPLALLAGLTAYELRAPGPQRRRTLLLAACPVVCGVLHGLYIVRVGGDFMHGRLLLPSLFAVLLPIAVVVPSRRLVAVAGGVAIVAWAAVCVASFRVPYADGLGNGQVNDERALYVVRSGNDHPVTLRDYRNLDTARLARHHAALAHGPRVLLLDGKKLPATDGGLGPRAPFRLAVHGLAVGVLGYAAGPRVHIVDQHGLGNPIGSRLRLAAIRLPDGRFVPRRVRAGHDKYLPREWGAARFAADGVRLPSGASASWVAAARRTIRCPPIERLMTAVTGPMTARLFLSNIGDSFDLDRLRFSANPIRAEDELCP